MLALETQTVHKLTHDFLLLDDDELSSESDSDSEGEGGEEGGRGGKRGRRRRNSSVDQVRRDLRLRDSIRPIITEKTVDFS